MAEIEQRSNLADGARPMDRTETALIRQEELDLLVLKKVVELYGGLIQTDIDHTRIPGNSRIVVEFRAQPKQPV